MVLSENLCVQFLHSAVNTKMILLYPSKLCLLWGIPFSHPLVSPSVTVWFFNILKKAMMEFHKIWQIH